MWAGSFSGLLTNHQAKECDRMRVKRLCVRVPKHLGEHTRQKLLEHGALDIKCRILEVNGHLMIPTRPEIKKSVVAKIFSDTPCEICPHEFDMLSSGPRSLEEALAGVLSHKELSLLPRAYDLIGDIAVLEIPPELEQYSSQIGYAFLSIHKNFKTVLAKEGAISGLTRTRKYRLLAGENKTRTVHTEYGVKIAVDLAVAYFSPRLLEEHHRVASLASDGERVFDMFTGVGPFALHITKHHASDVVAVDINGAAIILLMDSIDMNQLTGRVFPVISDARDYAYACTVDFHRIIMNHPSGSEAFVDAACRVIAPGGVIHFYSFIAGNNPEAQMEKKITRLVTAAGRKVSDIPTIRKVRDSAPYEFQMVADVVID